MAGLGITNLPMPGKKDRIDRATPSDGKRGFETKAEAMCEDGKRAQLLRKADLPKKQAKRAKDLAILLDSVDPRNPDCESLASSVGMRWLRIIIVGALWKLVNKSSLPIALVTIVPPQWRFPSQKLHKVEAKKLKAQLRSALNRCDAKEATGWLFCWLHGEFDPVTSCFILHFHGVACGGMIDVVDRLRKSGFMGGPEGDTWVYRPLFIQRKLTTDLSYLLSYQVKSYWPACGILDELETHTKRRALKSRILNPHASRMLLWIHHSRPTDICLLMHLRVTKSGLKTSSGRATART